MTAHLCVEASVTVPVVHVQSTSIGKGLSGAVSVFVSDVSGLYGADVQLSFDPSAIQAVDADPDADGIQIVLGHFLSPDLVIRNTADNDTGSVHFAVTQINPREARSGSGELFTVLFEGLRQGTTTTVSVDSATLASRDGVRLPSSTRDGIVKVVSAFEAPETPTAAPVAKPTLILHTSGSARVRDVARSDTRGGTLGSSPTGATPTPTLQVSNQDTTTDAQGTTRGESSANLSAQTTTSPNSTLTASDETSPSPVGSVDVSDVSGVLPSSDDPALSTGDAARTDSVVTSTSRTGTPAVQGVAETAAAESASSTRASWSAVDGVEALFVIALVTVIMGAFALFLHHRRQS